MLNISNNKEFFKRIDVELIFNWIKKLIEKDKNFILLATEYLILLVNHSHTESYSRFTDDMVELIAMENLRNIDL